MGIAFTVKFKRGIQGSRFNWLVILPVWLSCAFLGFVLMSLYINPAARLFFKLDYWKAILQFEESLRLVHTEYVDPNKSDLFQLSTQAVNGMLEGLDRHSRFFDSTEYKVFNDDTHRRYVGIGIMIRKVDRGIMVTRVFSQSPAEIAGIQIGDVIDQVNAQPIEEIDLETVSNKIKGIAGTTVKLSITDLKNRAKILEVAREQITISSLDISRIDENGTAYMHLVQFTERSGEEVRDQLIAFEDSGFKNLILDLRDNSGGLLSGAIDVASLFLPTDELIVSVRGRKKVQKRDFKSRKIKKFLNIPMIILLNEGSASASEIVAGALSKSKRAVLVGEKSFGKGSVQTIYPLDLGSGMKLTTAMYFFTDGSTIHETGIEPDHPIPCSEENETKLRLQRYAKNIQDSGEYQRLLGFEEVDDQQLEKAYSLLENNELNDSYEEHEK